MRYRDKRSEMIYKGNGHTVELCRKLTGIYNGEKEESTFFRVRTGTCGCFTFTVPLYAVRYDTDIPVIELLNRLNIFSSEPVLVPAEVYA